MNKRPTDYVGENVIVTNRYGVLRMCEFVKKHPKTYRGKSLIDLHMRYMEFTSLIPKDSVLFHGELTLSMAVLVQNCNDVNGTYGIEIQEIRRKTRESNEEFVEKFKNIVKVLHRGM